MSSTLRVTRFACLVKAYLSVRDFLRGSIRHFKDIDKQGFCAHLERDQCVSFYAIRWFHRRTCRNKGMVTIAGDILKNFTNNHHKPLFLNEEGLSHCLALIMPNL